MQDLTLRKQVRALLQARNLLNQKASSTYSLSVTRAKAEELYGRPISERTWGRWLEKAGVLNEDPLSEASHLLVCVLAHLLRGGGPSGLGPVRISRQKLANIAMSIAAQGLPSTIPESLTYDELKAKCELRAMQGYCDRHHRRNGLKKTQKVYSRSEALAILSRYPNWLTHVSNAYA
jgi:hypothetical protein